ncbi:MAG: MlaD family protein [Verrucomicrobiae bacterium]|nr:MlaD family protein [Verrucomicrobiae bacterium]
MRNTLETRLGIFAALAVIVAVIILELAGSKDLFLKTYPVHALFKNVHELKVGDPVKMAGVPVGRVDSVTLTNNLVQVTLRLRKDVVVRTDSKARIKFTGLMGQNFVALDFGSEKGLPLEPGKFIETVEGADLSEMLAKVDNVASGIENITRSFSGDRIDNLLGPLTDFLKQNREPLTLTIGNLRSISDQIAQGRGTVGRLIREDTLHTTAVNTLSNFEATALEVRSAIDEGRAVIANAKTITTNLNLALSRVNEMLDGVQAGKGTVGLLLKDDKLYTETSTAMTNLREIMQKINRGQGSVGRLVNDESLFKNAKLTLQKLDKATESLEDQGPLSVLGMAVGTLF